jgi:hypothetical protein
MSTYSASATTTARPYDLSRWLWDVWELPAVKAWLQTSHGKRHALMRIRVAMKWFESSLWWAMSRAFVPEQRLQLLDPEYFASVLEEFSWKGVALTPAAERQILEYAGSLARNYIECEDMTPERLREILMSSWIMWEPIAWTNRYLLVPELLGEYGAEIRYGHPD